jgi:predicted ATPase
MALMCLLLQPTDALPHVLILDEPELGLHPSAMNVITGLIRSVSRDCQVILATQSVALLDHFDAADVVTVNRRGRESVFGRPDPEGLKEWLEAYSVGELWEKNVLCAGPWS